MSGYPSECLRGISSENQCLENKYASLLLFNDFKNVRRADGFGEASITWNDNDEAVQIISNQRKDTGEVQFKIGLAVLRRAILDTAKNLPQFRGFMSYERNKNDGNPYHGNILLLLKSGKSRRNMLASFLAMKAKVILRNKNWDKIPPTSADIKAEFLNDNTKNE